VKKGEMALSRLTNQGFMSYLGLLDDAEDERLAIGTTVGTDTEVHLLWEGVSLEGGGETENWVGWSLL